MAKPTKAKSTKETPTANTVTKLNPGQPPVASNINTKVKAAKDANTTQYGNEKKAFKKKDLEEPIILITNDDGISSPGLAALVDAVKDLGKVVVIAPDKAQSGMGHAITIGSPLRMSPANNFGSIE